MEEDKAAAEAADGDKAAAEAVDKAVVVGAKADGDAAEWAVPLPGDPAATAAVRSADISNRTNKAFPACSGNAPSAGRQ